MPTLLEDLVTLSTENGYWKERDAAYARLKAFIEANQPWLPPQQEGFGPWIEFKLSDPGPRIGDVVHILYENHRQQKCWKYHGRRAGELPWSSAVAYCVKLPEAK